MLCSKRQALVHRKSTCGVVVTCSRQSASKGLVSRQFHGLRTVVLSAQAASDTISGKFPIMLLYPTVYRVELNSCKTSRTESDSFTHSTQSCEQYAPTFSEVAFRCSHAPYFSAGQHPLSNGLCTPRPWSLLLGCHVPIRYLLTVPPPRSDGPILVSIRSEYPAPAQQSLLQTAHTLYFWCIQLLVLRAGWFVAVSISSLAAFACASVS